MIEIMIPYSFCITYNIFKPIFPRSERTVRTEDVVSDRTGVLAYTDILENIARLTTELDHVTGKTNKRIFPQIQIDLTNNAYLIFKVK